MNYFKKAGVGSDPLQRATRAKRFSDNRPTPVRRRLWLTIVTVCFACSVGAAKSFADKYALPDGVFSWDTFLIGSAWGLVCTVIAVMVLALFAILAKDIKKLRDKSHIASNSHP